MVLAFRLCFCLAPCVLYECAAEHGRRRGCEHSPFGNHASNVMMTLLSANASLDALDDMGRRPLDIAKALVQLYVAFAMCALEAETWDTRGTQ
eukprot:862483-Amphidinium_carterae.1